MLRSAITGVEANSAPNRASSYPGWSALSRTFLE
jgi:hypothetical protein